MYISHDQLRWLLSSQITTTQIAGAKGINPTSDQTGFRSDLEEWTTNVADTPTANWLPAWPSGADHPPFFRPSVSRAQYESFRGMQGPIFCYPDGAESNACVAMNGDHATFLGSRTPERE